MDIEGYLLKISNLTKQIEGFKKEMEDYMMKSQTGSSALN